MPAVRLLNPAGMAAQFKRSRCAISGGILSLSAFANEAVMTPQREIISGVLLALIAGGYALYLALAVEEEDAKG